MQLLTGLVLAVAISSFAYGIRSLNGGGSLAAAIMGTLVFGIGGWQWAAVLLAFFFTSSTLTRSFENRKDNLNEKYSKHGPRDAGQVVGNGFVATVFVVLHALFPDSPWPWLGYTGALASVTADTWATELGALSRSQPRLITQLGRRVVKGTSGAVSLEGSLAALLGSIVIGLLAATLSPPNLVMNLLGPVIFGGVLGSAFDSFLGATVQGIYFCPRDRIQTEQHPLHRCGSNTIHLRGWRWLNNDLVNLGCSAFGALSALFAGLTLIPA